MLKLFLKYSTDLKNQLLQELLNQATDPVICMRRFRMLRQLSVYESQVIKKIQNIQSDDVMDFLNNCFEQEANHVVSRNA